MEGQFLAGQVAALRRVAGVAQAEVAHFLEVLAVAVDRHGASQPLAECAEHPLEFVSARSAQQRGIVQQHAASMLQFVMQALAQESLRAIRGTPLQQAREQRFQAGGESGRSAEHRVAPPGAGRRWMVVIARLRIPAARATGW